MAFVQKTVYTEPTHDYYNYAVNLRGRLINEVAEMEEMINYYICQHFCSTREKKFELMEVLVGSKHVSFQAKAEILKFLLIKNKECTEKEAKTIFDKLVNTIGKQRNVLAHAKLDSSRASIKKFTEDKRTIYFIRYENGKQVKEYGKKQVDELTSVISAVRLVIGEYHYKKLDFSIPK